MLNRIAIFAILLLHVYLSVACAKSVQYKRNERYYQDDWCTIQNGKAEYILEDNTRVDCLTVQYAIEFDFARKWYEAIGQSLYYALMTNRAPGIVLIFEKPADIRYLKRLNKVLNKYNLNIKVWIIDGTTPK